MDFFSLRHLFASLVRLRPGMTKREVGLLFNFFPKITRVGKTEEKDNNKSRIISKTKKLPKIKLRSFFYVFKTEIIELRL
jgi:hypothetical protein